MQDVLLLKSTLTEAELSHVYVFHPSQRDWVQLTQNLEISEAPFEFQRNVKAPSPGARGAAAGPRPGGQQPGGPNSRPMSGPPPGGRPAPGRPGAQPPPPGGNPFQQNLKKPASAQMPPGSAQAQPGRQNPQPQSQAQAQKTTQSQQAKAPAGQQPDPASRQFSRPATTSSKPSASPQVQQTPKAEPPTPTYAEPPPETNPFRKLKRDTRNAKGQSQDTSTQPNPLIPLADDEIRNTGQMSTGLSKAPPFRPRDVRNKRLLAQVPRVAAFRSPIIALDSNHLQTSQKWPLEPNMITMMNLSYLDQNYSLEVYLDPSATAGDIVVVLDRKDYRYFLDLLEILGVA